MHPRRSAQDIQLCDLCEIVPLQSYCELCRINLCTNCVGKHLSDSSKRHNVVPYKQRKSTPYYPTCQDHAEKHCELFCEKCDIPVCSTCVLNKHRRHNLCDVLKKLSSKTQSLQKDLEELETRIYPRYKEMASNVQTEKAQLETKYGKLTVTADEQGEALHREIIAIVNQRKYDIAEMKNKHLAALDKHIDEITHRITELREIIQDLRKILDFNDISLTSTYKSRNAEFKRLPPKVQVTLPSVSPQKINTDHLNEMFGSLLSLSISTEEHGYTIKTPEAVCPPPVKPMFDEPLLTATIDTEYTPRSVSSLSDEQVWTSGLNKIMKLFDLQGKLLQSIQTESENRPRDMAVTRDGDLVYIDTKSRTINIVKNKQIQAVITLHGWRPLNVCRTSSDDLLVTMNSDDITQSKVVRYSAFTETQTIQYDDQGRRIYSSGDTIKYISENRNLDICVADNKAKTVVVVNQSGKVRFRYTGHFSNTKKSFNPRGITTDSQSHILTADGNNNRIHILDQDGQFLCYIQNCDIRGPCGLCVDTRDNLFVAECDTNKVKKIQYL